METEIVSSPAQNAPAQPNSTDANLATSQPINLDGNRDSLSFLQNLPGLEGTSIRKEIDSLLTSNATDSEPAKTEVAADNQVVNKAESETTDNEPAAETTEETEAPDIQNNEPKSIFNTNTNKDKKVQFKDTTEAKSYYNDRLGFKDIDPTTPEGLATIAESFNKHRVKATKLAEVEKELNEWKDSLTNAPQDLIDALIAWGEGKDYRQTILNSPSKIDFNKSFDEQNQWELAKIYAQPLIEKSELTEEDFLNDESNPIVVAVAALTKEKFDMNKANFDNERISYQKKAKEQIDSFKSSVTGSVEFVKSKYPEIPHQTLKKIEKVISGNGLKDMFYNADNTLKQDAALKLMYAEFAPEEFKAYEAKMEKMTKTYEKKVKELSDQLAEFVGRGNTKVANPTATVVPEGNNPNAGLPDFVQKQLDKFNKKKS